MYRGQAAHIVENLRQHAARRPDVERDQDWGRKVFGKPFNNGDEWNHSALRCPDDNDFGHGSPTWLHRFREAAASRANSGLAAWSQ
jgi:hypothetical protein